MNKPSQVFAAVVSATATLLLATPVFANAQLEPSGRDFGQHVAHCAQTMGLDGTHNPGIHRGFSGWDGMPCRGPL